MKKVTWQCTHINEFPIPEDGIINGTQTVDEWLNYTMSPEEQNKQTDDFFRKPDETTKIEWFKHHELQKEAKEIYRKLIAQSNKDAYHCRILMKLIWMYDQYVQLLLKEKS